MRGDSDCATGCPSRATWRISAAVTVRAFVLRERGVTRGEEVVHLVRLAHEVEEVDLRGVGSGLDRREAGVCDRRRRQARLAPRVIGVVAVELRLENRLRRR